MEALNVHLAVGHQPVLSSTTAMIVYIIPMSTDTTAPEVKELNPSARSAAGQGSNIPLGWKPTISEPVPVVRCVQIKRDGKRCGRWSLRGTTKCYKHNGNGGFKSVHERAAAVVESARLRLIDEADGAIDMIIELTQPGTAEAIRLKASTEILDRAGIRGGFEVDIAVEVDANPADVLRKRLTDLREGAAARDKMMSDVVEGEVVEDSEQLELFDMDEDA